MTVEEKTTDVVTPEADATAEKETTETTQTPEEIQKKLEYLDRESKEAFKQRDEAKRKLKEMEDQKEKEKLEALQKAGKFEELNAELLRKQDEWNKERSELLTLKEEKSILEQQIKSDLLNKIPEAKRKFAERFSIEELKEFVALEEASNPQKVGTADAGRPAGKGTIDGTGITVEKFEELSKEQKEIFAEKYPSKYRSIISEINSKRKFR